ncbi:MAG TPA: phosphoribosylamine--glycine ligase [bacterium]
MITTPRAAKKVLVIGSGGREHALCWRLARSPHVARVFCAPGNGGTGAVATNVAIAASDSEALLAFARKERIDLTVVGPEAPLVAGIVDHFQAAGLAVFGPTAAAARLEGSKAYAKAFMARHHIPTAAHAAFTELEPALAYLRANGTPIVVKASGLAAGKGVIVAQTVAEAEAAVHTIMVERAFGSAGAEVVIEECLLGEECSVLAITDGTHLFTLPAAQDHKAIGEGDTGPNTGGMGAYCPAPILTPALAARVEREILRPVVDGMRAESTPLAGVLYAGLMIVHGDPYVLEFNCRFGDPECQPLMANLDNDLYPVLEAAVDRTLADHRPIARAGAALTVVMASEGYPGAYPKGREITGIDQAATAPGTLVFHAGTRADGGRLLTSGGRVLGVTGLGPTLASAQQRAYAACEKIRFAGAYYRRDIGAKALARISHHDPW